MNEFKQIKYSIEHLLFSWGDLISINDLAKFYKLDKNIINEIISELIYEYKDRGVNIIIYGDSVQIISNPEYSSVNKNFGIITKKKRLSNATLETVTIIAYLQPITKIAIEKIRGVKSDGAIQNLLDKNIIYEAGKLKTPGKPIVFKTTDNFLKHFNLNSLNDLPELLDRESIKEYLKFTEINEEDIELYEDEYNEN